jgi:DNA-binding response OmpR family regulator
MKSCAENVKSIHVLSVGKMESLEGRSQALIAAGFTVFSTEDPEQAMKVCDRAEFDIAIVGHLLSGSEKQRLVRYFREKCGIPVLLVTEGPFLTTLRADAYVPMHRPVSELVATARQVALKVTEPKSRD